MDRIQEKLLGLLVEIDRICQENGLDYFLGNETAICALRLHGFAENCNSATVFMPSWDYDRFETIADNYNEKYEVESIKYNTQFPFTFMHFVDKDTTAINLTMIGIQKHPGIAVKIMKLLPYTPRSNNDDLNDKIALGAALYEECFGSLVNYPDDYSGFRIDKIKNNKDLIRNIYGMPLKRKGIDNYKYYLQQHRAAIKTFPINVIESGRMEVEFEGVNFYIPKNYCKYMDILYGRKWRTREIEYKPRSFNYLMDMETPYGYYMSFEESLIDEAEQYRISRRERTPYDKRRKELLGVIERQNWYYERTVDRFYCVETFLSNKSNILQMYVEGRFGELSFILLEYQQIAEKYIKRDLPFAFDKDFYIILCDLLIWQGITALSKKLIKRKNDAFMYLNDANADNQQVLTGTAFKYNSEKELFIRKRGKKISVSIATTDELHELAYRIREKLANDDDDTEGIDENEKEIDLSDNHITVE